MNLVIVESPAKARTIESYLGKEYKVVATVGHILDLPKNRLGVDVDHSFEPEYIDVVGKSKVLTNIRQHLKKTTGEVYLALDPDREGESIAWQVKEKFKLPKKTYRVVFHEITKPAIQEAIAHKSQVNEALVGAQKARRVLDRLVGYPLSQLIWKKIRYGLSAGRVQSAALRLIVEREREIEQFKAEEFWNMFADVANSANGLVTTQLHKRDKKAYLPSSKKENDEVTAQLKKADWEVTKADHRPSQDSPPPPFITASLQQNANSRLGYSAKLTMSIAQRLYQGVDLTGIGRKSLITYMRTDSVALSDTAIEAIRKHIKTKYGESYIVQDVRRYKNRTKLAQEAHEAIRPTHFDLPPEKVKDRLAPQEYRLYKLIWDRAVATQMKPAIYEVYNLTVDAKTAKHVYQFSAEARVCTFAGYQAIENKQKSDAEGADKLQKFAPGETLKLKKLKSEQQFTQPPGRYTDASIIKKLKDYGIGRPSTYASIISTLITRTYVERFEKSLKPSDVGMIVSDFLVKYFPQVVDYQFTAEMEDQLDDVANEKIHWQKPIADFWPEFIKDIKQKDKTVSKQDLVILGKTDEKCPKCDSMMVLRLGRYGKFYSCSRYPDCDGIKAFQTKDDLNDKSDAFKEKYEDAPVIDGVALELKRGRFGYFWAHPDYPKMKVIKPLLLKEKCPECGHNLVERQGKFKRTFIGCSNYPKCRYIKKTSSFKKSASKKK